MQRPKSVRNGARPGGAGRDFPIQGRWWTPDPAGMAAVDPANPQSWNRYAYLAGNPLTQTDPLGLCPAGVTDCFSKTVWATPEADLLYFEFQCNDVDSCSSLTTSEQYAGEVSADWRSGTPATSFSGDPGGTAPGSGRDTGTIGPISRAACASLVADSEYSIAAHTTGDLPENPVVQAFLGNAVSGLYNMWNAPSVGSAMEQLAVGGSNPGIPDGNPVDGGLVGASTDAAIRAAAANFGEAAGRAAARVLGLSKFLYDGGSWVYAFYERCSK